MFVSLISTPTKQIFTASSETEMVLYVNIQKSDIILCIGSHIIWRTSDKVHYETRQYFFTKNEDHKAVKKILQQYNRQLELVFSLTIINIITTSVEYI